MMETQSKDEIVKADIMRAAEELFQKWGLNKTTMEDIAKQAGKGKSTLYYYFKSKEDIFTAVAMKEMNEIFRITTEAVENAHSAGEKLQAFASIKLQEMRKRVNCYELVRQEVREMSDWIKSLRGKFDSKEVELLKKIIVFGIRNGDFMLFNETELDLLSTVIVNSFRSIEMELVLDNRDHDQQIRLDFMVNILVKGLKR